MSGFIGKFCLNVNPAKPLITIHGQFAGSSGGFEITAAPWNSYPGTALSDHASISF
jgi:hypothetical protein